MYNKVEFWLFLELSGWKGWKKSILFWGVIGLVSLITIAYAGRSIYIIVMSFFWIYIVDEC